MTATSAATHGKCPLGRFVPFYPITFFGFILVGEKTHHLFRVFSCFCQQAIIKDKNMAETAAIQVGCQVGVS